MFDIGKNDPEFIEVADGVSVALRRSPRAKNISLRLDEIKRVVVLIIPNRVSLSRALKFAKANQRWIENRIISLGDEVTLQDGAVISVLGQDYTLNNIEKTRAKPIAFFDDDYLCVQGDSEFLKRRTADFLKKLARDEISKLANLKANSINKKIKKIRIADQKTRWGSCTSDGVLSFSWRLILCPEHVLDYVVAHEVAHMEHMDHSRAFWKKCQELSEHSNVKSKQWLKQNGKETRKYVV